MLFLGSTKKFIKPNWEWCAKAHMFMVCVTINLCFDQWLDTNLHVSTSHPNFSCTKEFPSSKGIFTLWAYLMDMSLAALLVAFLFNHNHNYSWIYQNLWKSDSDTCTSTQCIAKSAHFFKFSSGDLTAKVSTVFEFNRRTQFEWWNQTSPTLGANQAIHPFLGESA